MIRSSSKGRGVASLGRGLRLAVVVLGASLLAACGTVQMGAPQASIDSIRTVRAAGIGPVAVGAFAPAAGMDKTADASVGVRATTLAAPRGSFAGYLGETLEAELQGAGLIDKGGSRVVEGWLTDRQVDASIGRGRGRLAARFVVKQDGAAVYDKELDVAADWESSFVGAVAIPAAINEFTALFRKLALNLVNDPDFRRAMAR